VVRYISASLEGRSPTLGEQANSASLETPSAEPSAGPQHRGNSASLEATLDRRNKQLICSPTQPTDALNANCSTAKRGSQTASSRHAAQRE